MIFLEYPVTRPIPLTRLVTVLVGIGALIFVVLITLINVLAVGYEPVSVTSNVYDGSDYQLWYEHILPPGWGPKGKTCDPAIINLNEGAYLKCRNL